MPKTRRFGTSKQRTGRPMRERDHATRNAEREENARIDAAIIAAGCPVQTRWSRKLGWH